VALTDYFKQGQKDLSAASEEPQGIRSDSHAVFVAANPLDGRPTVEQLRKSASVVQILAGDGLDTDLVRVGSKPEFANDVYF